MTKQPLTESAGSGLLPQNIDEAFRRAEEEAKNRPAEYRKPDSRTTVAVNHWEQVVPRRFGEATLASLEAATHDPDNPLPVHIYESVVEWIGKTPPRKNVVIIGEVGVGKSWLAAALCRETAERYGWINEYVSVQRMFLENNQAVGRTGGLGSLERYVRAHCLVLDDVGVARAVLTEAEENMLSLVINERWLAERVTIVTTNLTLEDFKVYVGKRILDRLSDPVALIELWGKTRRVASRTPVENTGEEVL
jgi:DNA replication protein DnaC